MDSLSWVQGVNDLIPFAASSASRQANSSTSEVLACINLSLQSSRARVDPQKHIFFLYSAIAKWLLYSWH